MSVIRAIAVVEVTVCVVLEPMLLVLLVLVVVLVVVGTGGGVVHSTFGTSTCSDIQNTGRLPRILSKKSWSITSEYHARLGSTLFRRFVARYSVVVAPIPLAYPTAITVALVALSMLRASSNSSRSSKSTNSPALSLSSLYTNRSFGVPSSKTMANFGAKLWPSATIISVACRIAPAKYVDPADVEALIAVAISAAS
jgi:hypothetical protein